MPQSNGEFLKFTADQDALVGHMILSQNGTAPTGLRELVMNCVDAGATVVTIKLTARGFEIADNGRGFQSRQDIESHFQCFGTPHKEGDAIFGTYRIGRGQIMSLAKCEWHSNAFRMQTDVENGPYGFHLTEDQNDTFEGCKVTGTFYRPLDNRSELQTKEEIAELVRYLDTKVVLNGQAITGVEDVTWDVDDEDVRIRYEPSGESGIRLYNLGVFVKELPVSSYGINAHVVTKKQLKVNMARNEVMDSDPLFIKIHDLLVKAGKKMVQKKASRGQMDSDSVRTATRAIRSGSERLSDSMNMPLLTDVRGHKISLNSMVYSLDQGMPLVLGTMSNHLKAERLATRKRALVLHEKVLSDWREPSLEALVTKLLRMAEAENDQRLVSALKGAEITTVEALSTEISDDMTELPDSALPARLQAALVAAQMASSTLPKYLYETSGERVMSRRVHAGESDVAAGWTDGKDFIWINVNALKKVHESREGSDYLAALLLHEYGHDFESSRGHSHDFEFYRWYHDVALMQGKGGMVARLGDRIRRRYIASLAQRLEKLPKWAYETYEVDKLSDVTITRSGPRVSLLAEMLLKLSGASVTRSKGKLAMITEVRRMGFTETKIQTALSKAMKADGLIAIPRSQSWRHYDKEAHSVAKRSGLETNSQEFQELKNQLRKEKLAAYEREFRASVVKWLEMNDQDVSLADQLLSASTQVDLLNLLVQDQKSDLADYHYTFTEQRIVTGSATHCMTGNFMDYANLVGHTCKNKELGKDLAADRNKREMMVRTAMQDALSMLADDEERRAFCKQYLNEEGLAAFGQS